MKQSEVLSIKNLIWNNLTRYLVFIGQLVVLLNFMRMDPDPHHDGVIYAPAVAVRDGGFPNRDVFAQYGPLVPELQGLWLKVFGPELLNLRFQSALISISMSIIIWHSARNFINEYSALLLSTAWVLTIPSVLPWPTLFSTLIVLISLLVLTDLKEKTITHSKFKILSASMILGIGSFGRLHVVIVFLAVVLFFSANKKMGSFYLKYWLIGGVGSISVNLMVLASFGALRPFVNQSIVWPFFRYTKPEITTSYIVNSFFYPVIYIACICFFLSIYAINKKFSSVVISYLFTLALFVGFFMLSQLSREGYLSLRNPKILTIDFSKNLLNSLSYLAAFSTFLAFLILIFYFNKVSTFSAVVIVYSVSMLAQLYPLYDVSHLWMIAPVLIICGVIVFSTYKFFQMVIEPSIKFFLVGLIAALILQANSFFNIERVGFESITLKGMLAPKQYAIELDKTMKNLEALLEPKSTKFDCINGIYSAAGGKYLASSPQFINWGPGNGSQVVFTGGQGILNEPIQENSIFVCAISSIEIETYINLGYQIKIKDPTTVFGEIEHTDYWNVLFVRLA